MYTSKGTRLALCAALSIGFVGMGSAQAGPISYVRTKDALWSMKRINTMINAPERIGFGGFKKKGYNMGGRNTVPQRQISAMTSHLSSISNHLEALMKDPGFDQSAAKQELVAGIKAMKVANYASVPIRAGAFEKMVAFGLLGALDSGPSASEKREDRTVAKYNEQYERFARIAKKLSVETR